MAGAVQAAELRTQHGEAEEELQKLQAQAQRLAARNEDLETQTQVLSPASCRHLRPHAWLVRADRH